MKRFNEFYLNEDKQYKIYVDLDGVLVDFEKQYDNYSEMSMKDADEKYSTNSEEFWKPINDNGVEFWSEMPWMQDGKELWSYIKPHNPTILSSPARGEACPEGKTIWIKRELGEIPYIYEKNKYKYSGENKILIDDTEKKITDWVDNGGIGILHTSTEDTIQKLKEIME